MLRFLLSANLVFFLLQFNTAEHDFEDCAWVCAGSIQDDTPVLVNKLAMPTALF